MSRKKGTIGATYYIVHQDENSATVSYAYLCPYCKRDTVVTKTYYDDFETLESGVFFDQLDCENCNKTANVRYWPSQKI